MPDYEFRTYPNGLQLIIVNAGTQPVFRLETLFRAGRYYEAKPLVASATLKMMREGTQDYSAEEIAEIMDFHGASLAAPTSLDESGLVLYGLNEHFDKLFPVYQSMLLTPAFPEKDLQDYVTERKQGLQADLSKNDVVAYRNVTEAVYGSEHPYGYNSTAQKYDALQTTDLKQHYQSHYRAGNALAVLSGKITTQMLDRLEQELFPLLPNGQTSPLPHQPAPCPEWVQYVHKPQSVQTAIRMGKRLFARPHPDYFGLYFLNVVLGDYFSSRLMMNLREDKGYTYNVSSSLDMMRHDGLFSISLETSNEYARDCLLQIQHEMERLQQEPIPEEELQMAKNYTLGNLLSSLDGPSSAARLIKGMKLGGMEDSYFLDFIRSIQGIGQEELMALAQKHLQMEGMHKVLVGGMEQGIA